MIVFYRVDAPVDDVHVHCSISNDKMMMNSDLGKYKIDLMTIWLLIDRKNDIITILSERDEHCWVGELNGLRGWFPAKFVEVCIILFKLNLNVHL